MESLSEASCPAVGRGFRLQWESAQDAHVLLYPEGMVKLNPSAAAILTRCDGARTVADIISDLERVYSVEGLGEDVLAFLRLALQRGWLEFRQ
jgi:pyrroloquinoline quinone biosynthesis protein D